MLFTPCIFSNNNSRSIACLLIVSEIRLPQLTYEYFRFLVKRKIPLPCAASLCWSAANADASSWYFLLIVHISRARIDLLVVKYTSPAHIAHTVYITFLRLVLNEDPN